MLLLYVYNFNIPLDFCSFQLVQYNMARMSSDSLVGKCLGSRTSAHF